MSRYALLPHERWSAVDFELDDEQQMLREVSRSMLAARCTPATVRALVAAGTDVDDKLWHQGVELGWTGLAVPEDQDGAGQGLVELTIVAEELGRALAPGPVLESALVALLASRHPDNVPVGLVAGLVEGHTRAALALSTTVSAAEGPEGTGGLLLSGTVANVQAAPDVTWLLVTTGADVPRVVLVPASEAVTRRRVTLDQTRGWHQVGLHDIHVDATHVLAVGSDEVQWVHDAAAVLVAADALGVGERLLEMTIAYTQVREQFGRAIGSFQAVKHKIADMAMALKGVRAATAYAAMALDAGVPDASRAASVAKAFASEQVPALAGQALQLHGGIGFTWEHDLHLYLRRAKVDEVLHGDAATHHDRVARLHF